ncbi:response regulator [Sporomusa acidovorans]|uniref:Chemotaxis protein CheY n=1 Tax=Sporomusa acidovorans (strain ATCC 49682 / DSM 3132 / Mol) TaxID=1123286 RepID=A0ABZ3IVV1_SPOA4|nr:response regulator [Sporomusa acidovorans]OZC23876.1 chemotaxis protein CheY [Sporomusa acidovorans DSM 3132]SDF54824.1 two-component system, chemotaxis family, response regulator CheY [Sporomusa acidovorans]
MRVLVVDHSEMYRETIRNLLTELGIEKIDESETGMGAINKIKRLPKGTKYDIVTIDIAMPRKEGLHVLKDMTILSPESKIIVCSSKNDISTVKIVIGFGVYGYIVKPFTKEKFLETFLKLYT